MLVFIRCLILFMATFLFSATANAQTGPSIQYNNGALLKIAPATYFTIAPQFNGIPPGVPMNCTGGGLPSFVTVDPVTCELRGVSPWYPSPGSIITFMVNSWHAPSVTVQMEIVDPNAVSVIFPQTYFQVSAGQPVKIAPNVAGTPADGSLHCFYSGQLPPGLEFNWDTCVISGMIPLGVLQPGNNTFQFMVGSQYSAWTAFQIDANGNYSVQYAQSSYQINQGEPVMIVPAVTGVASGQGLDCGYWNELPPGLQFDWNTCAISGTIPLGVLPAGGASYQIGVMSRFMQQPVMITLNAVANYSIQYPASSYQLDAGVPVNIVPAIGGLPQGQSLSCGYSGTLPPGLSFNHDACEITGTIPLGVLPAGGTSSQIMIVSHFITQPIYLTLNASPNYSIQYSASSYQINVGSAVVIVPSASGIPQGQSLNCGYSGTLPPGLSFNFNSCAITGTVPYGVIPPAGASYPLMIFSSFLPQGQSINVTLHVKNNYSIVFKSSYSLKYNRSGSIAPTTSGFAAGQSKQCSLLTSLPNGLSLNSSTCVISGTMKSTSSKTVKVTSPYMTAPAQFTIKPTF